MLIIPIILFYIPGFQRKITSDKASRGESSFLCSVVDVLGLCGSPG